MSGERKHAGCTGSRAQAGSKGQRTPVRTAHPPPHGPAPQPGPPLPDAGEPLSQQAGWAETNTDYNVRQGKTRDHRVHGSPTPK